MAGGGPVSTGGGGVGASLNTTSTGASCRLLSAVVTQARTPWLGTSIWGARAVACSVSAQPHSEASSATPAPNHNRFILVAPGCISWSLMVALGVTVEA